MNPADLPAGALTELAEDYDTDITDPIAPGVYEFDLDADVIALVTVSLGSAVPGRYALESSEGIVLLEEDEPGELAAGDRFERVLDSFDYDHQYHLELTEGDEIEIHIGSPAGDFYYELLAPGEEIGEGAFIDDSDEGLYGYDAKDTHEISKTGEYRLLVGAYDGVVQTYILDVHEAK